MKAVDGWIVAIGIVALGLAAVAVMRAREATQPAPASRPPPVDAPLPPGADFPACRSQPSGKDRWLCQARQAQQQGRTRCYGQHLYYVVPGQHGMPTYYRWPAALKCWSGSASSTP